jgi:hypothetical protein
VRVATRDFPARQPAVSVGLLIALGLASLGFLGSAIYAAYLDHDYSTRRALYNAASPCPSGPQIANCRYVGDAQVVQKTMPAEDPRVELKFTQLSGLDVTAYLYRTHTAEWNAWRLGSALQAELWHGNVTKVAGVETLDNPDTLPEVGPIPWLILAAATLACAAGFAWFLLLNLRSGRGSSPS